MSRIVTKLFAGLGLAAVLGLGATAAEAHVNWSIGINVPGVMVGAPVYAPAPVYVQPAPVYVAPPPPVYYRPQPVYYTPPPVYYRPAPPPVYYAPGYWGRGEFHHHRR